MTLAIDDLAAAIDAATSRTVGTDLFTNYMPDSPDACTSIYETPGSPPVEGLGSVTTPAVIMPRLQILARGAKGPGGHDEARGRAREVYNALIGITNQAVGGAYYLRVRPLQEPFLLRRDENERPYFAFNVEVHREPE